MTFSEAEKLFNTARSKTAGKPIANNTRLFKRGDDAYAVKLHDTDVVTIHEDGTYTYNSGGWQTLTTKERINRYSPLRLYQERGIWKVADGAWMRWEGDVFNGKAVDLKPTVYQFEDGMRSDADGIPIDAKVFDAETEKLKRKFDRQVSKYIKAFCLDAVENGLSEPNGGDCWMCLMHPTDRPTGYLYGTAMGYDHFISHFEDKYYVPSMVLNAIRTRGYGNEGVIWSMIQSELEHGKYRMLADVLRSYFTKLKPNLFKEYQRMNEVTA